MLGSESVERGTRRAPAGAAEKLRTEGLRFVAFELVVVRGQAVHHAYVSILGRSDLLGGEPCKTILGGDRRQTFCGEGELLGEKILERHPHYAPDRHEGEGVLGDRPPAVVGPDVVRGVDLILAAPHRDELVVEPVRERLTGHLVGEDER